MNPLLSTFLLAACQAAGVLGLFPVTFLGAQSLRAESYPPSEHRINSPGNTAYYVDPVAGDDTRSGLIKEQAWRSFNPVNRLNLAAGDQLYIIAPGAFEQTLTITGRGSAAAPINVHFAPGRYDMFPRNALRRKFPISNTNDDPDGDKAIGLLFDHASHVELSGPGARLVCRGKMMHVCVDASQAIGVSDLSFDYHRPTVSEFRVTVVGADYADLEIHKDSVYEISHGEITWVGEGWIKTGGAAQELDPETNVVRRRGNPLKNLKLEEITPFRVRATGQHDFKPGHIYQIRDVFRDYVGVFTRNSKDITWKNLHVYFVHGMGLVSQFSENLTFDTVSIAPDPESGRTCAGWADGIQVSGCRGRLLVRNCTFSGTQDDAINIHGTHLQVAEVVSSTQVKVRFVHKQTYGFMAFNEGDEVTFVRGDSLVTYGANVVKAAEMLNPKELLLTFESPVPADINEKDALENVTWTPEVEIRGCKVMRSPTRGFLITTRRKVLVEDNVFQATPMSAILVENDARGWFESGPVRDLTIRHNTFFYSGEPVIHINPQNGVPNAAVHRNIRIEDNQFVLKESLALRAKSTTDLSFVGNTVYSENTLADSRSVRTDDCAEVQVKNNRYLPLSAFEAHRKLGFFPPCGVHAAPGRDSEWFPSHLYATLNINDRSDRSREKFSPLLFPLTPR